jgi:hypothetical protein
MKVKTYQAMKTTSLNSVIILEGMKINATEGCKSLTDQVLASLTSTATKALGRVRKVCTVKNAIYTVGAIATLAMWFHAVAIDNTLDAQRQMAIDALFACPALCVMFFDSSKKEAKK